MGSDVKPLSELCDESRGITYGIVKVGDFIEGGVPVIRGGDIRGNRIVFDDSKRVSEEVSQTHKRTILQGGEIIINLISDPGHTAIVPSEFAGYNVSRDVAVIPLLDTVSHQYVNYLLKSPQAVAWFEARLQGSVTQKINLSTLKEYPVPLPPLPEQKAIAHILGTFDDKIELNRRMNATLEGMAQALFKSWFVDFDPVIDNALAAGNPIPDELADRAEVRKQALANGTANREAAKDFPDAFQFTEELGWIPKGWEVSSVEHERTLRPGLAYKAKHKAEIGTPMVTLGSVSFTERFLPKGLVNYTGEFKAQHLVSPGDLVIASHDITQERKQLGSPAMIPRWISSEEIIVATNLFKLSNDRESYLSDHFLYWTLRADKFREEMIKSARGTAILFINRASAGKYLFARPPRDLSQQFDGVAESLYDAHQNNEVSSRSLIVIRDTLLPKLISGEVSVSTGLEKTKLAM